ncbi:unnamed protein product [Pleuronectes platessa]|uniref:Uncharacterized protein n=1 Tax=Pleuronectes platessa TaxID=8262 RepID=A0A9N7Z5R9_PLEPL|nr:unnamed protein product [Pleuronectes platessa]
MGWVGPAQTLRFGSGCLGIGVEEQARAQRWEERERVAAERMEKERESAATVKGRRGAREENLREKQTQSRRQVGRQVFGQRCQATGTGGETYENHWSVNDLQPR